MKKETKLDDDEISVNDNSQSKSSSSDDVEFSLKRGSEDDVTIDDEFSDQSAKRRMLANQVKVSSSPSESSEGLSPVRSPSSVLSSPLE